MKQKVRICRRCGIAFTAEDKIPLCRYCRAVVLGKEDEDWLPLLKLRDIKKRVT